MDPNAIDDFLATKEGNVPLTPDEFRDLREFFVSKDEFDGTQKLLTQALDRSSETDTQLRETLEAMEKKFCDDVQEVHDKQGIQDKRLLHVEEQHDHDEECHQLTARRVKKMIAVATLGIAGAMLILAFVAFVTR